MPTGYTARIEDGTIKSFPEFAETCMRAMTACISMKDEPFSAKIPKAFKPSPYSKNKLKEAKKNLKEFNSLNKTNRVKLYEKDQDTVKKYRTKLLKDAIEHNAKYDSILSEINKWNPDDKFKSFKNFMIEQINLSKSDIEYYKKYYSPNTPQESYKDWEEKKLERLKYDIEYYEKEWNTEVENCKSRNLWISELRSSLRDFEKKNSKKIIKKNEKSRH